MKFLLGTLFGILLSVGAFWGWRAIQARQKPRPTSQVINQPTKAREVKELKPGREPDGRFVPMHVERH